MQIELTFLGTGTSSGIPMIGCSCAACMSANIRDNRLRTSALIRVGDKTIVIDAGMDFRQQMLRENVKSIDALLLTHPHMDHIGGIDDLRAFNYFMNRPCDIYCNDITAKVIRHVYSYAFEEKPYPGAPKINLITIENNPFKIGNIDVIPIEGLHAKMKIFGYRIGDLVYITDMNRISEEELDKAKGCKVLVINALRRKPHLSHFTLDQAIEISRTVSPYETYLTHISHQLEPYDVLENLLPENVHSAYDGLKLLIS